MNNETQVKKFSRISQSEMPRATLKDSVMLAEALRDNFAGKDATPIDLAKSVSRSPTSSTWRFLTGAAVAYGITDGGYGADSISLTTLGRQIVSPTEEGLSQQGLMSALVKPAILKNFYEKYNKAKFPQLDIAKNVLNQLGVPQERTDEAYKILVANAEYVGVMTEVGGSKYIQLDSVKPKTSSGNLVAKKQQEGVGNWQSLEPSTEKYHIFEYENGVKLFVPRTPKSSDVIADGGMQNVNKENKTFSAKLTPDDNKDKENPAPEDKEPPADDTGVS